MFGLGLCFKLGADSVLLYDSLKEIGRTHEYANTYKREERPSYFSQVRNSVVYAINHQRVKSIIIYSVFIYVFWRIGFWYYQPYMKAVNIDAKYFGIIFAVFNLMAAINAWKANSIIKIAKHKSLTLLSILFVVSFLLIGRTRSFIGVFFIIPQEMARGIRRPIVLKHINENIPSNKRATIISFKSLAENLVVAMIYPLVGMIIDNLDIVHLHTYTGLAMLLGTVGLYIYLKKSIGTSKLLQR